MEPSDRELLDRFITRHDDAAFRQLVERHLAVVHGVARRVTGNEELARDVAQNSFLRLAQRAALIPKDLSLAAWLHRVTHHLAIDLVRSEERRKKRELISLDPALMDTSPSPVWSELAPVIDNLVNRLPAADRDLLLLRYYRNEPHAAVARQLGLSEAATKKRAARALEKLRALLAKKGISTTAAALATILPAHAATPVPGSYVLAVSAAAKGAAPLAASSFNVHLAMTTAQKTAIAAAAIIFMASASYALRSSSPENAVAEPPRSGAGEAGSSANSRARTGRGSPLSAAERLERLRLILAIPSAVERPRAMLAFIDELGSDQFAETAAQLEQLKASLYGAEFGIFIGAWTKANPLAAVAWAKGSSAEAALVRVLEPWGEADPAAALDWVVHHIPAATGPDVKAREALIAVLAGTASRDFPAAVKGLESIPEEKDRIEATKQLASQLSGSGAGRIEALLDAVGQERGGQYSALLAWSFESLANSGRGEHALELYIADEGAQKLLPMVNIFRSWQGFHPEDALAAIDKVPAGSLQDQAVAGYCVAAVNSNPPEIFALLHRYPGAATDMVLAEMGQECAIEDVALGIEQMLPIKDATLRNEVLVNRLKWWLQRREADARKWMEAHELPAEVRDALKGPVEPLKY
ncbi:sigma-70 family RNA polymerase sigma factor [Haloferula sp. BvORR071]|uniref:RNA polymerase sigma factor n=1 Tax=Haloferula sp. BvORR071 TaxID=1396141 RepID=UPI0005591491|nr:sigma-70 family RNA polymerase sigma factor [Haloferula sp. BvORR071]